MAEFKRWLLNPPRVATPTEYDNIFIGPCQLKIGSVDLGATLESNPTKISIKKETVKVKPQCKGGAVVKTISKITSITAETSILYNSDILERLKNETGFSFNDDFIELKNVNVKFKSDEVIEIFECNIEIEQNLNFKKSTLSEIRIQITGLKTDRGYYKIGGIF